MTAKTKFIKRAGVMTLCVLSLLMFPSCQKAAPTASNAGPPEAAILAACKQQAGKYWAGGNISDIVRGTPITSEKGTAPPVTIYPLRVVYDQLQEQPHVWDPVTRLPRPGEWKAAPMRSEFHFVQNEFGEWLSQPVQSGWVSPPPPAGPLSLPTGDPRNWRSEISEAYARADLRQLEALLRESKDADQKNGVSSSAETKLREFWLESAKNAIAHEIADEEEEAERLYWSREIVIDGRTVDEIMFLREWKHPKQARAVMEREKAKEEAELTNDPDALARYRSDFESAKAERAHRMREEIEYQRQRASDPERFPAEHRYYFPPGEVEAWKKAQHDQVLPSGASRNSGPIEQEKQTADQVAKAQVARVQAESEAARKQHPEKTPPPNTEHRVEVTTKSFLARFIESGGAETPDEVVSCYAELVDYYDQGQLSRDQIRQDATEHFGKWPKRSYRLVGEPQIAKESDTKEVITCDVAFEVSDGKRRIEGVAQNSITLDVGTMKIVSIREKIVRRRTTAIGK